MCHNDLPPACRSRVAASRRQSARLFVHPLILEGTVEATLGHEAGQVSSGGMLLVPEMVPHNVRNVGTVTAKLVGFFGKANVISTFEEAFQPSGMRVFDTAQIPVA